MKISNIMTQEPVMISPDVTLREAAEIMKDKNIGVFPVCEQNEPIGVLTDRDIVVRCLAEGRDFESTYVRDIMTRDVVTCNASDSANAAFKKMLDNNVGRLMVTNDNEQLIGIVTMSELLRDATKEVQGFLAEAEPRSKKAAA